MLTINCELISPAGLWPLLSPLAGSARPFPQRAALFCPASVYAGRLHCPIGTARRARDGTNARGLFQKQPTALLRRRCVAILLIWRRSEGNSRQGASP